MHTVRRQHHDSDRRSGSEGKLSGFEKMEFILYVFKPMDDDERGIDPVTGCATRTFTCLGDQSSIEVLPLFESLFRFLEQLLSEHLVSSLE